MAPAPVPPSLTKFTVAVPVFTPGLAVETLTASVAVSFAPAAMSLVGPLAAEPMAPVTAPRDAIRLSE